MTDNPEGNVLQQASVDYLQQINQNVVSLNSTAMAQREIAERTLSTQEATKGVMDEVKTNTMASVHNQAYMAYGTFQHDVQGMAGFTDSATRTALATMQIAGRDFVSDAGNVYNKIESHGAGVMNRLMDMAYPPPVMEQGLMGSIFAGMGLKRGPESVYQQDYEELSRRQRNITLNSVLQRATFRFGAAAAGELGQEYDPFAYRMTGAAARPLSEEEVMRFGGASQEVVTDLRRIGIDTPRGKEVARIGMERAFRDPTLVGGDSQDRIANSVRDFGRLVGEMTSQFKMSVTDMARALSDFSLSTGMNPRDSANFLRSNQARLQGMGVTPTESIPVMATAIQTSRALGIEANRGAEEYLNVYENIRKRFATNYEYAQTVSQLGGQEAVAQREMERNTQFMRSNTGMLYAAAGQAVGPGNLSANMPMSNIVMAAANQMGGSVRSILRARYHQIYGFKGEDMAAFAGRAQANIYLEPYKLMVPDATYDNVKTDPEMKKDFKAFLSFQTGLMAENDIEALFSSLFEIPKATSTATKAQLTQDAVDRAQQDTQTRKGGFLGFFNRVGAALGNLGNNPSTPAQTPSATAPSITPSSVLGATQTTAPPQQTTTQTQTNQDYYKELLGQAREMTNQNSIQIDTLKQIARDLKK